jgi:hypothetical protein
MAATLEELQALRTNLIAAIASGTYQVKDGEKLVIYQTTDAMRKALGTIDNEIAKLSPTPRRKRWFGSSSKAL